jgi:hypothetical protein
LERALDIALNDKSDDLAPFRDLVDQRGQSAGVHAMGEYLTKLVNQEVAARVSEVAIESCLSPNGATLVNTIESTQNSITKPLEQMHALQNDLAVGLTAMHQLKNSILTDYSPQNMEFLSKYGHSLAKSDLSVSSLNNLTLRMNEMGDSVPLSVAQLQSASIEMMSPDSTSGINYGRHFESVRLPSNELDMAKTLTREGLNLSTPQFDDALLMARLEIGQIVVDSPSVTIDNTADMTRSLSELLNKTKNEPSKTTSIDSDSPSM